MRKKRRGDHGILILPRPTQRCGSIHLNISGRAFKDQGGDAPTCWNIILGRNSFWGIAKCSRKSSWVSPVMFKANNEWGFHCVSHYSTSHVICCWILLMLRYYSGAMNAPYSNVESVSIFLLICIKSGFATKADLFNKWIYLYILNEKVVYYKCQRVRFVIGFRFWASCSLQV